MNKSVCKTRSHLVRGVFLSIYGQKGGLGASTSKHFFLFQGTMKKGKGANLYKFALLA